MSKLQDLPLLAPGQVYVHRRTPDGPIVMTSSSKLWEATPPCEYVTIEERAPLPTIIEEDPDALLEKWGLKKPILN